MYSKGEDTLFGRENLVDMCHNICDPCPGGWLWGAWSFQQWSPIINSSQFHILTGQRWSLLGTTANIYKGQTKKMCSQIYIRHNKKCSFDWSKKMPPECGLDLRGYDQFLYYFCTFLRNRPPSWRITQRKKKMKIESNQNIPSGIKILVLG